MTRPPGQIDRRRHPRISPKGAVRVALADVTLHGRIANISRDGIFVGTSVSPPERLLGRIASLDLRLDGGTADWERATGRVGRIEASGLAIMLDSVSDSVGDLIDEMSSQARVHGRTLSVVLIDNDQVRSASMLEGFRAVGCTVLHVSTPLEAIVRLGESSFEPDLIAIGDTASGSADEMRAFVQRCHPRARLVAIGTDASSAATSDWLSSEDPLSDLPDRVLRVLGRPRQR